MKTWIIAVLAVLLVVGSAAAYMGWRTGSERTQVYNMMNSGTYADLVAYRQQSGVNMMPWIDSEESFKAWQEYHAQYAPQGYRGGCPMRGWY